MLKFQLGFALLLSIPTSPEVIGYDLPVSQ